MMVSLRAYNEKDIQTVSKVSAAFPSCHGGPIHIGFPEEIGIEVDDDEDTIRPPDLGDAVEITEDEVPIFWACGSTPIEIIKNAGISFAIMHGNSCVFVTDLLNSEIRVKPDLGKCLLFFARYINDNWRMSEESQL